MSLPNEQGQDKGSENAPAGKKDRPVKIEPAEFFAGVAVGHPEGVQCIVTAEPSGAPNDHRWGKPGADTDWMAKWSAGRKPAYLSMAAYNPEAVGRSKGRTAENALAVRGFWLDIEASPDKYAKNPEGGYPDEKSGLAAVAKFTKATRLVPSYLVKTGSGGVHLHYVLDAYVTPKVWLPRARALVRLAAEHGFKIDAQCTTDAARIMRAPGSIHQKTGKPVEAYRWRVEQYGLAELGKPLGYDASAEDAGPTGTADRATGSKYDLSVNGDLVGNHPPYSYKQAAEKCMALRQAANRNGQDTPYQPWTLALGTARLSTEGPAYAHEISAGHADYDEAETDKKLASLNGGPAGCNAWADAWGPGGPCYTCEFRGQIKNPAVQLGAVVDSSPVILGLPHQVKLDTLRAVLPDWHMRRGGDGAPQKVRPMNTVANVAALAPAAGWRVRRNEMSKQTEMTAERVVVPQDDQDNTALALFGDVAVRVGMTRNGLSELVEAAAAGNRFHPVRDSIAAVQWDGRSRLDAFYSTLELADPTQAPLRNKLVRNWALQGIGALVEPEGIAAQGVLVLNGPQGCGKTTWYAGLSPVPGAVRCGAHLNPDDKDSVLSVINAWIVELGEIDSTTRRSDVASLKAFLTRRADVIRLPYARREATYARRTVFGGSVNFDGYLADDSGNRRFWNIRVKRCTTLTADEMQQVWAEFMALYQGGERWHLDRSTQDELNAVNLDHMIIDPLREKIGVRYDWGGVAWGVVDRDSQQIAWKTSSEVCADVGIDRPTRADATRVGAIIRDLQRLSGRVTSTPLERKSNGIRRVAVPAARGAGTK